MSKLGFEAKVELSITLFSSQSTNQTLELPICIFIQ